MNKQISYPAKTILFGEHSVVYPGYSAILSPIALNTYCSAKLVGRDGKIVFKEYENPRYKENNLEFSLEEIQSHYNQAKTAREEFTKTNNVNLLTPFVSSNFGFLKVIFGIAFEKIFKQLGYYPSISLEYKSEIPHSAGFGYSATLGATLFDAIFQALDRKLSKEELFDLTLEYEKYQHGNPSGADHTVVINRTLIEFSKKQNGQKTITKLKIHNQGLKNYLSKCYILHTGSSSYTTGEMVGFVKERYEKNKKEITAIFDSIQDCIEKFKKFSSQDDISEIEFMNLINQNGIALENLGVVSDQVLKLTKKIRNLNGAAKVAGGGGRGQGGSGAVIIYLPDFDQIRDLIKDNKYTLFPDIIKFN